MNKKIMILFLVLLTGVVFGKDNLESLIKTEDNFYKCTMWQQEGKSDFDIQYFVAEYNISVLKDEVPYELTPAVLYCLSQNGNVTGEDLQELLKTEQFFILDTPGKNPSMYRKLYNKEVPVGETFFTVESSGRAVGFYYNIILLNNDRITCYDLSCTFGNAGDEFMNKYPDLFVKNQYWGWKNKAAISNFFSMMLYHNENLPEEFIDLQILWENIISEVTGEKYGDDLVSFLKTLKWLTPLEDNSSQNKSKKDTIVIYTHDTDGDGVPDHHFNTIGNEFYLNPLDGSTGRNKTILPATDKGIYMKFSF